VTAQGIERGLAAREPSTWLVLAMSCLFVLLGLLFLLAPRLGAALFGLPAPEGSALAYLPAIGLRDLAFGLYLFALARLASRTTLGVILAVTALIPVGDITLVALERGLGAPGYLLLHGLSALILTAAAIWLLVLGRQSEREERL
jgi:hypothetical protein